MRQVPAKRRGGHGNRSGRPGRHRPTTAVAAGPSDATERARCRLATDLPVAPSRPVAGGSSISWNRLPGHRVDVAAVAAAPTAAPLASGYRVTAPAGPAAPAGSALRAVAAEGRVVLKLAAIDFERPGAEDRAPEAAPTGTPGGPGRGRAPIGVHALGTAGAAVRTRRSVGTDGRACILAVQSSGAGPAVAPVATGAADAAAAPLTTGAAQGLVGEELGPALDRKDPGVVDGAAEGATTGTAGCRLAGLATGSAVAPATTYARETSTPVAPVAAGTAWASGAAIAAGATHGIVFEEVVVDKRHVAARGDRDRAPLGRLSGRPHHAGLSVSTWVSGRPGSSGRSVGPVGAITSRSPRCTRCTGRPGDGAMGEFDPVQREGAPVHQEELGRPPSAEVDGVSVGLDVGRGRRANGDRCGERHIAGDRVVDWSTSRIGDGRLECRLGAGRERARRWVGQLGAKSVGRRDDGRDGGAGHGNAPCTANTPCEEFPHVDAPMPPPMTR